MKTAMKITLLCASIIVQPMMMRADDHDKKCVMKKDMAECLMHIVTHWIALMGGVATTALGYKIDEKYAVEGLPLGTVTGLTAALGLVYKMPQWTDTHILKKEGLRTRAHNIIVCLSRLLLLPVGSITFGVIAGESLNMPLVKEEAVTAEVSAEVAAETN